jgi:hypothetical protein
MRHAGCTILTGALLVLCVAGCGGDGGGGEGALQIISVTPGPGSATVAWQAPGRVVDGCHVLYSASPTERANAAVVTANRFTVTGLTNGVPYEFQVVVVEGGNEMEASAVVTATPQAAADTTPPDAPGDFVAQASDGAVVLSWIHAGGADAAGCNLYRATGAGPFRKLNPEVLVLGDSATQETWAAIDRSVDNGTVYRYRVRTVDAAGNESADAGPVEATPEAVGAPASSPRPEAVLSAVVFRAAGGTLADVEMAEIAIDFPCWKDWDKLASLELKAYRNGELQEIIDVLTAPRVAAPVLGAGDAQTLWIEVPLGGLPSDEWRLVLDEAGTAIGDELDRDNNVMDGLRIDGAMMTDQGAQSPPQTIDTDKGRLEYQGRHYDKRSGYWPFLLLQPPPFWRFRSQGVERTEYVQATSSTEEREDYLAIKAGITIKAGVDVGAAKAQVAEDIEFTWETAWGTSTEKTYSKGFKLEDDALTLSHCAVVVSQTEYRVYEYLGTSGELNGTRVRIALPKRPAQLTSMKLEDYNDCYKAEEAPRIDWPYDAYTIGDVDSYPGEPIWRNSSEHARIFDHYGQTGTPVWVGTGASATWSFTLTQSEWVTTSHSLSVMLSGDTEIFGSGGGAHFGAESGQSHTFRVGKSSDYSGESAPVVDFRWTYKYSPYAWSYGCTQRGTGTDACDDSEPYDSYLVIDHYVIREEDGDAPVAPIPGVIRKPYKWELAQLGG